MAVPTTPEEVVYARLSSDVTLGALVSDRITPQITDQEIALPCVVYQRTGKDAKSRLNGTSRLGKYTVTVTAYGATESQAHRVSNAVHDRLCPDEPWTDSTVGLQGCFAGDSTEDVEEGGVYSVARPFDVWWGQKPSSLLTGLVAYWKLDETSGTRFDSTTNDFDLTANNNPLATIDSEAAVIGHAAKFVAASSQYLDLASNTSVQTGEYDWTFAGWVYLNSTGSVHGIAGKWDIDANREWILWYTGTRFRLTVRPAGAGANTNLDANTFGAPAANTWYFLAVQHDQTAGTYRISVNAGTADTTSAGATAGTTAHVTLGMSEEIAFLDGRADECGFWRSAAGGGGKLSTTQLTDLYNAGAGVSWPFAGVS